MAECAKAANVCIIHMLCFNILQRGLSTSPHDVYMSDAVMRGLLACSPSAAGSTQVREQGTVCHAHPQYQCSPDCGARDDSVLSAVATVEPQAGEANDTVSIFARQSLKFESLCATRDSGLGVVFLEFNASVSLPLLFTDALAATGVPPTA